MKHTILMGMGLLMSLSLNAQQMLSLDAVKQKALENNMKIHSANKAIEQAREQKKEAYTNYFPQVQAVGMAMKTSKDMMKGEIKPSEVLPASLAQVIPAEMAAMIPATIPYSMINHGVMAGVSVLQPVFMGGQIVNGNKLAKVGEEVAVLQKQTSRNEVMLTAEQYYWQIVSLKEKMKTLDAVSELLKKYEKDAEVAVKAGVGLRNDLLSVQLKQNEVEGNRLKLENGLKLSRMVLAQYIGMEGQEVDVSANIPSGELPPYPSLLADDHQTVVNTPEYQLLQKNVGATALQRKMESGKILPSVAVGAGYNYFNMGAGINNNFGAVFATVSIPISKWWSSSHAVKRSQLAEENAREQLEESTQLLKIRLQKSRNEVEEAYKQLALSQKAIAQSEENLRLNRDYYKAGTSTMNNLLEAQQKYQQCRDGYTDAFAELQKKMLEYKIASNIEH